jgi:subtilase family serine protease
MRLAIGLPLRNRPALTNLLRQLYDPSSPLYHKYLAPDQFTASFGPAEKDYQAFRQFAESHRLAVTATHPNRLLLDVTGAVADVENTFHVNLRVYPHPTEPRTFYAPDVEPSVDASLPIADISGLNNFVLPHPQCLLLNPSAPGLGITPKSGSGSGGTYLGNDFRAAYLPGVTLTGSGQIVGMLEFDGFYASDISAYETLAGLPAVPLQTVLLDGYNGVPTTGSKSGNPEVSLDIEMGLCMAPGLSKIVLFEAGPNGTPNDILNAMAASNQISQFSCSWGWGGGPSTTTDNIFQQMAAQGQSFFDAVGDSDAFTSGSSSVNGVDKPSLPNAPSSSPYITEVGGTTLTTTGPGGSWSSETAWNWGLHSGSYVGTSGGISSYYSIPSWQANVSMAANGGSTTYRNTPDVALTADNIYVSYGNGTSGTFGGTSCAAPLWAGLAALMNQQSLSRGGSAIGFVNPAVYAIGSSPAFNTNYHDITTGNNTWPSSPNSFYAVVGYDLCTGWGTPAGQGLINALAGLPDSLGISPANGFAASGPVGGPFSPTSTIFQLTNSGAASLTWSLGVASAWLQVSSTTGVLPTHGATNVTVNLNAATAATLAAGVYTTNLWFTNVSDGVAQSRLFTLTSVGQQIVLNGGFETGDFTSWTPPTDTTDNFVGSSSTPFRIGNHTVYYGSYYIHSGTYAAFLGELGGLAYLSQILTTIPGRSYLLSFWLVNPAKFANPPTPNEFMVAWNGTTLFDQTDMAPFNFTNMQYVVSATATSTTLEFGARNDPDYFGLDDVSVTSIPSPLFQAAARAGSSISLTWTAVKGVTYQLQYTTSLSNPNWTNLGNPITASSGLIVTSDPAPSDPQRFYRVILAP